jgi:hypothetical protein
VPAALGSSPTPADYRSGASVHLGPGLDHLTLSGRAVPEAVHVARLSKPGSFELRAVPANGAVGRGLERTSSICTRVHCTVAVNGDFFGPHNTIPLGGVISAGQLLRSPSRDHPQLMLSGNGSPSTGILTLTATLVTTDLKSLRIDGINRALPHDGVVLYTPAFGPRTATNHGTTEVTLLAKRPAGPVVMSKTTVVGVGRSASRRGNNAIPAGGAVIAASGGGVARITDLIKRMQAGDASSDALLRVESPSGAVESIGGGPVLVHNGASVVPNAPTDFSRGRHPRTIVGWTPSGDILLVTVDGRQPGRSLGMTLPEAARFMIGLGAREAINLDGGGSTTFVERGRVVNTPSDKAIRRGHKTVVIGDVNTRGHVLGYVERPVATALVVVPKSNVVPRSDGDAFNALPIPATAPASAAHLPDEISALDGSKPAIVVPVKSTRTALPLLALALLFLALSLALAHRSPAYITILGKRALRLRSAGFPRTGILEKVKELGNDPLRLFR